MERPLGWLTTGCVERTAFAGRHPEVGGARVKDDLEGLGWGANADLAVVLGLEGGKREGLWVSPDAPIQPLGYKGGVKQSPALLNRHFPEGVRVRLSCCLTSLRPLRQEGACLPEEGQSSEPDPIRHPPPACTLSPKPSSFPPSLRHPLTRSGSLVRCPVHRYSSATARGKQEARQGEAGPQHSRPGSW